MSDRPAFRTFRRQGPRSKTFALRNLRSIRAHMYRTTKLRLVIKPEYNLLAGKTAIVAYLKCHWATVLKLKHDHGLPVIQRPDGIWITTVSSIDSWLHLQVAIRSTSPMARRLHYEMGLLDDIQPPEEPPGGLGLVDEVAEELRPEDYFEPGPLPGDGPPSDIASQKD